MALNDKKDLKLFYSIGEVAQMFNVNESLLRFWEKEFPQIAPVKTSGGTRKYRKEDIEAIKLIYHLVKEKGMTLPGARQMLSTKKDATVKNHEMLERLKGIKAELLSIRKELDRIPNRFAEDDEEVE